MTAITLPPLPLPVNKHGFNCIQTLDDIRARDLEVARVVLEAAAKEMEKVFGGHLIYGYPVGETIRALEVRHG